MANHPFILNTNKCWDLIQLIITGTVTADILELKCQENMTGGCLQPPKVLATLLILDSPATYLFLTDWYMNIHGKDQRIETTFTSGDQNGVQYPNRPIHRGNPNPKACLLDTSKFPKKGGFKPSPLKNINKYDIKSDWIIIPIYPNDLGANLGENPPAMVQKNHLAQFF